MVNLCPVSLHRLVPDVGVEPTKYDSSSLRIYLVIPSPALALLEATENPIPSRVIMYYSHLATRPTTFYTYAASLWLTMETFNPT